MIKNNVFRDIRGGMNEDQCCYIDRRKAAYVLFLLLKSMKNVILKYAGLNALGTALYVAAVAIFMSHTSEIFNGVEEKTALIPFAMLLLFVLSATVTGSLVIGRPVLWYLDGKKKEAVRLFIATVGFLFFFTLVAFLGLALLRG